MAPGEDETRDSITGVSRHVTVHYDETKWAAVCANNGGNGPTWQWENELLVGFNLGVFKHTSKSHQTDNDYPFDSWLARSIDGGETWSTWKPEPYVGQSLTPQSPFGGLDFTEDGFLMRIVGNGYHGNRGAHWFYSRDRGAAWSGPFDFGNMLSHPELEGKEFTARTGYIIDGPEEMHLFFSVRQSRDPKALGVAIREKTFLVRTVDGGKTFSFVSWVVPWDDPYRAVMAAPVKLSPTNMVAALRRKSQTNNWIDCYTSTDNGMSWSLLSKVGYTETGNSHNGNPPALVQLSDGRLCCVYGNRTDQCMIARFSEDEGNTWGTEKVLRDDFESINGFPDLGYPRLFQRPDGKLVTAYFWCSPEKPQTHIEATIFE